MGSILDNGGVAIPHYIHGFPYPERDCPYCELPLILEKTCHIQENPEHYKAIYQCHNEKCVFLDNDGKYAYLRVYYSSDYAEEQLWKMLLKFPRKGRR